MKINLSLPRLIIFWVFLLFFKLVWGWSWYVLLIIPAWIASIYLCPIFCFVTGLLFGSAEVKFNVEVDSEL